MKQIKWVLVATWAVMVGSAMAVERVVSTAGNASEIVAALGKEALLVGVDTTSMRPKEVMADKPKIGYRRQLSAEGILSLNPDLILLAPDAGPPAVLAQIEASGSKLLRLKDSQTLAGIREEVALIAHAIGAEEAGNALIEKLLEEEKALDAVRKIDKSHRALVLIDAGSQAMTALGAQSAGANLLAILQLDNAFTTQGRKPMSDEALASTDAAVILLASRVDLDAPTIAPIAPEHRYASLLAQTVAGKHECVFTVNLLDALGFGLETARFSREILQRIEPCLLPK